MSALRDVEDPLRVVHSSDGLAAGSAPSECGPQRRSQAVQDFLADAPRYLAAARKICEEAAQVTDAADRQHRMDNVYSRVERFAVTAGLAQLNITSHIGRTLGTLLKKLCSNPKTVTPSTLNTVCKALSFMQRICEPGVEEKLVSDAPVRMLVVEDDPLAKRAVMTTLERAFEKPESANDGAAALALVEQKSYDVIFTDVEMPFMNGFELCALIRTSGPNRSTPVVFITSLADPESHAQGYQSGGSDFIAKPFLPIEMTVKALTFAWEGRLQQMNTEVV
jgi:CheY-like chemotaxis protein